MAEEQKEPQQVPQQVTTKNPKKVEAGKRLAAHNRRRREQKKREVEKTVERGFASGVNQYYGIGAILPVGVIGGLGYYIYRTKKGPTNREVKDVSMSHNPPKQSPQTNKFEMD